MQRNAEIGLSAKPSSVVACQPTINTRLLFAMALDAHPHLPGFLRQPLEILDLTVALLANNLAVDVPLVVEKDVFGNVIHLDPGGGRPGVEIIVLFLDPGEFHDNVIVAVKAFFHRRDPGEVGVRHVRVAELALDLLDSAVDVVAEGDGLLRADLLRLHVIKIKEGDSEQDAAQRDQYRSAVSSRHVNLFRYARFSALSRFPGAEAPGMF
jgi:hypothetical protein